MKIEKRVSEEHVGTSGKEAAISVAHQLCMNYSAVGISTGNVSPGCPY